MSTCYKRIVVSAPYHAHIAKLIRTVEPLLTIAQKRQLKKEGQYNGQSARLSRTADQHLVPTVVNDVRQFVVGHCDPGKRHQGIVHRYVEEALKNMNNLEVVASQILTTYVNPS